jgi:hypothetical protein
MQFTANEDWRGELLLESPRVAPPSSGVVNVNIYINTAFIYSISML